MVTGAEGFVGKELVYQFRNKGIEVIEIDFVDSSRPNYHQADIRSKEFIDLIPEGADVIIHLAALSRDQDCKDKAYECFDINVMGTLNLVEAASKKNVKQFIFASSEWVYDNCNVDETKTEESIVNIASLNSEYALSKIVSETNLRQKHQYGFCPITILRFGIIYGPRKSNWSAVESLFNAVNNDKEITVGSLKTGRCFIHISDIVSGIIKSIGLKGFNIINLEGDEIITLRDVIETSKKILNKNPKVFEKNPSDTNVRSISNEKAKKILNWHPEIDLDTGLKSLLDANKIHL